MRILEGAKKGQFLFSSQSIIDAESYYNKVKILPYRHEVPIKNIARIREYLTPEGWMISAQTIEQFPQWLKISIAKQAIWKWLVLFLVLGISLFLLIFLHRTMNRRALHSHKSHLYHLVSPISLMIVMPKILHLAILLRDHRIQLSKIILYDNMYSTRCREKINGKI